jgi:hypothetical protein
MLCRLAVGAASVTTAGRSETAAVLGTIAACAAAAGVLLAVWAIAWQRRRRAGHRPGSGSEPADDGAPDRRGPELVRELTEEVRRWRAESEYWKQTALRLQRELDGEPPTARAEPAGQPEPSGPAEPAGPAEPSGPAEPAGPAEPPG